MFHGDTYISKPQQKKIFCYKKYFVAKKYLLHQYVTISIDLSASEVRHQYSSEIEEVYHDVKHQLSSQ